jgi:hypothetical protein
MLTLLLIPMVIKKLSGGLNEEDTRMGVKLLQVKLKPLAQKVK